MYITTRPQCSKDSSHNIRSLCVCIYQSDPISFYSIESGAINDSNYLFLFNVNNKMYSKLSTCQIYCLTNPVLNATSKYQNIDHKGQVVLDI